MADNPLQFMVQPLKVEGANGVTSYFLAFQFTRDEYSFTQMIPWSNMESAEELAQGIHKNILAASDELYRDSLGLILPKKDK